MPCFISSILVSNPKIFFLRCIVLYRPSSPRLPVGHCLHIHPVKFGARLRLTACKHTLRVPKGTLFNRVHTQDFSEIPLIELQVHSFFPDLITHGSGIDRLQTSPCTTSQRPSNTGALTGAPCLPEQYFPLSPRQHF